ncbi:MAG: RagB/SusD family nutrient uptake outer membrane protein [Bacteroidales bacterium]|nr:RagB/SusD family nutrient uptake outer membrane protein [Bacteroidales bacterium]
MKKINILFALICLFTFSSCEEFLDKAPTNYGDTATAVKTAKDAMSMVNGILSKMSGGSYLGRDMFLYADAKGGDMTIISNGRGYDGLYLFSHATNSGAYSGFWTTGYNIIMQINSLLATIEKLEKDGSTEDFDNIKGQILTYRAMIYFDLVRLYGEPYNEDKSAWGVPDVKTVLDPLARVLRATVAENYATIESDLTAAQSLLDKDNANGYINYYGNLAIQARVYLAMERFDDALEVAEEIITDGDYELYTNEKWVQSWSEQFGDESIFEIYMLDEEGDLGSSSLGGVYSRKKDYTSSIGGYYVVSDYFMNRLKEDMDDVRWGIMTYDETSSDRLGCCYKYLGGIKKDSNGKYPGDGKASASACNIKVIRLSEIYLIAAEAALRQTTPDAEAAADYLNEIRKRSPNLEPATAETITLDMILDERSKELVCEGHRFWDLIRNNRTIEFDDFLGNVNLTDRGHTIDRTHPKTILPIFTAEINANPDIATQQNPGYSNK